MQNLAFYKELWRASLKPVNRLNEQDKEKFFQEAVELNT